MTTVAPAPASDAWQARLAHVVDLMRDMSRQTDPQEMVQAYGERVRHLTRIDRRISLSRRGLTAPVYRVTRSTTWPDTVNPWAAPDRLPVLRGGLVADLLYGDQPQVIDHLDVPADDPAAEYLSGHRSLFAIPLYDGGTAQNMVLLLRAEPAAFARDELPELVWMSNLFGRATNTLVLAEQLRQAHQALDRELKAVGEVQRSLLPATLPRIPTLDVAAYYKPSARAGGDYYDFFPLPGGRWGVAIADVSGHGSPAAVLMAVTHCMAHTRPGPAQSPGEVLNYLNRHLATLYTGDSGKFVTAFYAVYHPADRTLTYASAGHNPPRLKRCRDGSLIPLDAAGGLPLGITADEVYEEAVMPLQPGDQVAFYTDGITEAGNRAGELFGTDRLDRVMESCGLQASGLLTEVLKAVDAFADGHPADDDRTMIVARVT